MLTALGVIVMWVLLTAITLPIIKRFKKTNFSWMWNKEGHLVEEAIAAYIDGTLDPYNTADAKAHLASCEECAELYTGAMETKDSLNSGARWLD